MTVQFQSSINPKLKKRKELKMMSFFVEIFIFLEMGAGGAPALRFSRAVTRLTVHHSLPLAKREGAAARRYS